MAQTIEQYTKIMLEASSKTRVMDVDDEYNRIQEHFVAKGISMYMDLTKEIEDELFAVFCEEYIHEYEYVNPHFNGFTRPLSERESNIMQKERVLSVVSKYNDALTYHDLLDLLGFEYHPISHLPQFINVDGEKLSLYTYYETICVHKETDLTLICFLGSSATGGSFGFELTQENWDNHVNRLAEEANAAEAKRFNDVNLHVWVEELIVKLEAEESFVLNAASQLGIIEGRNPSFEVIEMQLKNNKNLRDLFEDLSMSEIQCIINYSLDCLNAKCRENGDPEIY